MFADTSENDGIIYRVEEAAKQATNKMKAPS
jgi:hypothetical protein